MLNANSNIMSLSSNISVYDDSKAVNIEIDENKIINFIGES